jgi:hypothetical protein
MMPRRSEGVQDSSEVYKEVQFAYQRNPVRFNKMIEEQTPYKIAIMVGTINLEGIIGGVPVKPFRGRAIMRFKEPDELSEINPGDNIEVECYLNNFTPGKFLSGGSLFFTDCKLIKDPS